MFSGSCNVFKFWQISGNISKTAQDRDIVAMEDKLEIICGLLSGTSTNDLECPSRLFQLFSYFSKPYTAPHSTTILPPFFQDHPDEPVPEKNIWTLWCKGRLTEADTPTIRLGAIPSGLTSAHLHLPLYLRKYSTCLATICLPANHKVYVTFISTVISKLEDFLRSQAVAYTVKIVISQKCCEIATLLL